MVFGKFKSIATLIAVNLICVFCVIVFASLHPKQSNQVTLHHDIFIIGEEQGDNNTSKITLSDGSSAIFTGDTIKSYSPNTHIKPSIQIKPKKHSVNDMGQSPQL